MSFLTQVMQHLGQFEQKTIHENLDALTSKLQEMTIEVHQLAESKYVEFKPNVDASAKLNARVDAIQTDINELDAKLNNKNNRQVVFSTEEFQDLNTQLEECTTIYNGLNHLAKIMSLLQESQNQLDRKLFGRAAKSITDAEILLKSPLTGQDDAISIIKTLKTELTVRKCKLDRTLADLWLDTVKWTVKTGDKSASPTHDVDIASMEEVAICVTSDFDLRELIIGLHHENILTVQMKGFAERFKKFVVPLLVDGCELKVENSTASVDKASTIALKRKEKSVRSKTEMASDGEKQYITVSLNFIALMKELNSMLLGLEFGTSGTDEASTLMSWLGQETATEVLGLLSKTVIAKAVPTSAKDLEGFKDVIEQVELMHSKLLKLGYIQPDNRILLNSVENVNMLFSNKKSQLILVEGRNLMTSDLHDSVSVTEDKPIGEWPPLTPGGVKKVQRLEVAAEHQFSDNTFRMPRCRISSNIQTVVTLAYEMLQEATESSSECACQMYLAIRKMFEMFCDVIPTHHGRSLEMFPQLAALHHNNCMFVAHHLMTLGHQYSTLFPHIKNLTFMDQVELIRLSGVDVLLAQISRQQGLLLECLEGAQGFSQLESTSEAAERSIKQALLQLQHLHKIWKPILPVNNYKKAMGRLINCVSEHITNSVVALEDIAQSAAHTLLQLLAPVEPQCGEMLVLPGEATSVELVRHVASWSRLVELQLILNSSLAEVGTRWSGGVGPLADAFKPEEVKQLVRALFQNTDRRAALLATIK